MKAKSKGREGSAIGKIIFVVLILSLFLLITFSACAQKGGETTETLAPETPSHARVEETPSATLPSVPETTQAPETIAPETTAPPQTTEAPQTTAPETTMPPETTAPPERTSAPETTPPPQEILEIYDVVVSADPNGKIVFDGKIRNNGDDYQFNVRAVAILYDEFENVIDVEKSVPVAELAPGDSAGFRITPDVLKSKVARYELKGESDEIKPEIPEVVKNISMEISDVKESIDPNGKLVLTGKVKNTGKITAFNVYVTATLYDSKGNVIKVEKSFPFSRIEPGETKSFKITSSVLRENIASYELNASWEEEA